MQDEWGPWIDNAAPDVGMYVQVLVRHDTTGEYDLVEGRLDGEFGSVMWFEDELPKVWSDWSAVRWRERLEPRKTVCQDRALEVC